jgi:hypothetical protein
MLSPGTPLSFSFSIKVLTACAVSSIPSLEKAPVSLTPAIMVVFMLSLKTSYRSKTHPP